MGKKAKTPDPVAVSNAQYDAATKNASAQARLNRVNEYSPYGSITYSATPSYDETGYNAAMDKYNKDLVAYNNQVAPPTAKSVGGLINKSSFANAKNTNKKIITKAGTGTGGLLAAPVAPDKNKYKLDSSYDTWSQTTALNPEQQHIFDQQQQGITGKNDLALSMLTNLQANPDYGKPVETGDIPQQIYSVGDPNDPYGYGNPDIQKAQDATYSLATRYLDPQMQQGQDQLNTRLTNQGLQPGTEAYNRAMNLFQTDKNRQYSAARDSAFLGGNALQNQLFTQQLNNANLNNQSRTQELSNRFNIRSQPLNELNGLLGGTTLPTYNAVPQANMASSGSFGDFYGAFKAQTDAQNQASAQKIGLGLQLAGLAAAPFTGGASMAASGALPVGTKLGGGGGAWLNPDSTTAMQLAALG